MLYSWHRDWGASSRPFFLSTETGEAAQSGCAIGEATWTGGKPCLRQDALDALIRFVVQLWFAL